MRSRDQSEDPHGFPPTHWSLVVRAGSLDRKERADALETLLPEYLPAFRRFLRSKTPVGENDLDDVVQEFLTKKFLAKEQSLAVVARPEFGRFRDLLKRALKGTAIDYWRKHRRRELAHTELPSDGHAGKLGWVEHRAPAGEDVAWARAVFAQILRRVRKDCQAKGQRAIWLVARMRDLRPLLLNQAPVPYKELVETLETRLVVKLTVVQVGNLLGTAHRKFQSAAEDILKPQCRNERQLKERIDELLELLVRSLGAPGKPRAESTSRKRR